MSMPNGHMHDDLGHAPAGAAPIERPAPEPAPAEPPVDLAAWARGAEDHPMSAVTAALDRYAMERVEDLASRVGRVLSPREALTFLIDERVISEGEARKDLDEVD